MLVQQSITNYLPEHPSHTIKNVARRSSDILYNWEIQHDTDGIYVIADKNGRGWETSYLCDIKSLGEVVLQISTINGSIYYLPVQSSRYQFDNIFLP